MLRRTNSYSYTAAERVSPACTECNNISICIEDCIRGSKDRNSLDRIQHPLPGASKLRHSGYLAVNVSQAVPAAVKFAISDDTSFPTPLPCKVPPPAILTMQRPRTPSKSSRMAMSSEDSPLDEALAEIKEQLLGLKMQRNGFVERMDSLQRGIHQAREDMLKCQQQQQLPHTSSMSEHPSTLLSLRRIRSLDGHSQRYVRSAVSQTEEASSSAEEVSESSLPSGTAAQPPERFSPEWKNRKSMPIIPSSDILSQDTSLNEVSPRRRTCSQSSKRSSKVLSTIGNQRPSSACRKGSVSPTATLFSNTSASKVLVAPCKSSRHQYGGRDQDTFESCTLPHLPVPVPAVTLQNVKEDESLDTASSSDSQPDELSQGSMIMQVSSATGQLEQVPKDHHSEKKRDSSYANHMWKNHTSHPNGKNLADIATLNRATAVILRLSQEPCRAPKVYRMRKANSIILNSIETTV